MKMHDGELDIDLDLVGYLVATQFPHLAGLPIPNRSRSTGTVNAIFRIGDDLYARLPRMETWGRGDPRREWRWLPQLYLVAPPLPAPVPVSLARPDQHDPFFWTPHAIQAGRTRMIFVDDEEVAAEDLARFVLELRRIDTTGAPGAGRRPLRELDAITREMPSTRPAGSSTARPPPRPGTAHWKRRRGTGTPVWIHTDLLRPNVLVRDGRISAVIDFGGAGIGDPAADVIAAWSVFGRTGRSAFRDALEVDDGTWNRARGFALHQAAADHPVLHARRIPASSPRRSAPWTRYWPTSADQSSLC